MKLDQLSPKECILICTRAESMWQQRLSRLESRVRPSDPNLADALQELRADEENHSAALSSVDAALPAPTRWRVDEHVVQRLLADYFPCLMSRARPKPTRSNIMQLVNAVENECARFYRRLAEQVNDDGLRAFFSNMAHMEEEHRDRMPAMGGNPATC